MSRKFSFLITSLFVFFVFFGNCIHADEKGNQQEELEWFSKNKDSILSKLTDFLDQHSLYPFIQPGAFDFQPIGMDKTIIHEKDAIIGFLIGNLQQNDKQYRAVFVVAGDYKTNELKDLKLLYIGNTVISPQLYFDVMTLIPAQLQLADEELNELGNTDLFIDQLSTDKEGIISQEWKFFNGTIKKTATVILTPDGSGGTYFSITSKQQ